MKCLIVFFFFSSAVLQNLRAQSMPIDKENWEKIVIIDGHGGWTFWHNEYQIDRHDLTVKLTKTWFFDEEKEMDSVIKKVDPMTIDRLFDSFLSVDGVEEDPLLMFGRDSMWLKNHALDLWLNYLGTQNESAKVDSIAVRTLHNYAIVKPIVWRMQMGSWTDDYPVSLIYVIKGADTISYCSFGQYPMMYPWLGPNGPVYNPALPRTISELLPENTKSNKSRLSGERFVSTLIEKVKWSIEDEINLDRAQRKYRGPFKRIERHFDIESADVCCMGSIEWGGLIAANCLELQLSDTSISKNIQFASVFGRRILPRPLYPIILKKQRLVRRLKDNPVYQYAVSTDSCLGEIHFVNRRSLSGGARREFLRDVRDHGTSKWLYRGKFRKATFFELTEIRDGQESFSRWIFFKNGKMVLWQLDGNYLMQLPLNYLGTGYVCTEIGREAFQTK